MTPLDLAAALAKSDNLKAQAEGVAIVARGLSDHDPSNPYRQGWPVEVSLTAAATHLGLTPTVELIDAARDLMPTLSPAILNHRS